MNSVFRIDVVESGRAARKGRTACEVGENLTFNAESLQSYFFSQYDPTIYDAFLVAAAIEFCDKFARRAAFDWARAFEVRIPVHDVSRWDAPKVKDCLIDLLSYLTGDHWIIEFVSKKTQAERVDPILEFGATAAAVIPFSNGLDSHAVSWLKELEYGTGLIRVHLKLEGKSRKRVPFTSVPFSVKSKEFRFVESSVRSRGFKFALISGLAGCISKADKVIVPESGSGILGPVLVPVGQAYEDYRSFPTFSRKVSKFIDALFGRQVEFLFPQIWKTKGQTLKEYFEKGGDLSSWKKTRSCWQDNRVVSIDEHARQCGVCAACMLRRLSVHAASASENVDAYVWESLGVSEFEDGASSLYDKLKGGAMKKYAIAGTLHLSHLAEVGHEPLSQGMLDVRAYQLGEALGLPKAVALKNMRSFLGQHEKEWNQYLEHLGRDSFVSKWDKGDE